MPHRDIGTDEKKGCHALCHGKEMQGLLSLSCFAFCGNAFHKWIAPVRHRSSAQCKNAKITGTMQGSGNDPPRAVCSSGGSVGRPAKETNRTARTAQADRAMQRSLTQCREAAVVCAIVRGDVV